MPQRFLNHLSPISTLCLGRSGLYGSPSWRKPCGSLLFTLAVGLIGLFYVILPSFAQPVPPASQAAPTASSQASNETTIVNQVPPQPQGLHIYVNDLAGLLTPDDRQQLQAQLQALDEAGMAQMSVLILPDSERDLSEFAPVIMNQWGIQHHGKKDGVLILVNARRVRENLSGNRIFVATGLALESQLPDALVGRILDENALPAFAQGQASAGITQTTLTLAKILAGNQELREQYANPPNNEPNWFVVVLFVALILIVMSRKNRFRNGGLGGGGYYPGGGGGFFGDGDGGGFGGGFGGGGDSSGGGGAGR